MNDNGGILSNVSMSGGRLFIPDDEYTSVFLPVFANDVRNGVKHYLIERATSTSRWFADIDLPVKEAVLDAQEWVSIAQAIQKQLLFLSGNATTTMIALRAETPDKTGIHLIAPELSMEVARMQEWCASIAEKLALIRSDVNWSNVLDKAVYQGGGSLRMVACHKMVPCPGNEPHTCECCNGFGKRDVGRPYTLLFSLDRNGMRATYQERALKHNTDLLVSKTSIRRMGMAPPEQKKELSRKRRVCNHKGGLNALSSMVRDLPEEHANLQIVGDGVVLADGSLRIRVAGDGARFCLNVGRLHSSSQIYYVVDEHAGEAWARCWCRKGSCVSWRGPTLQTVHAFTNKGKRLPPQFQWGT